MKIHDDIIQGSEQWFALRKERVTASIASQIVTPTGRKSSSWEKLARELVSQHINPVEPEAWAGNADTDRGNELEDMACEVFAKETGLIVRKVGFVTDTFTVQDPKKQIGLLGCSPDRLVYHPDLPDHPIAGLEAKCPRGYVHGEYLAEGCTPAKYLPQVHYSMMVTKLPWFFVSYAQGYRPHITLNKPDGYTALLTRYVEEFLIFYAKERARLIQSLAATAADAPRDWSKEIASITPPF